ncbi:MAG: hypothetical protein GY716_08300 [bacterium]|nr:hypothetical protein [bacterium]
MRSFEELEALSRRVSNRVPTRLGVRFGVTSLDHEAWAQNVSIGGLYLSTDCVYAVGTLLRVRIDFPDRSFDLRAKVMWAIQVPAHQRERLVYGMGIQFVNADPGWPPFFRQWMSSQD